MTDSEIRQAVWEPAIRGMLDRLGDREVMVLHDIACRLAAGQNLYGKLTVGKKDWAKELYEELLDGLVYGATGLAEVKGRGAGTD